MAQPELVTTSGGREIKDYIDTYDCIMAGDLGADLALRKEEPA